MAFPTAGDDGITPTAAVYVEVWCTVFDIEEVTSTSSGQAEPFSFSSISGTDELLLDSRQMDDAAPMCQATYFTR